MRLQSILGSRGACKLETYQADRSLTPLPCLATLPIHVGTQQPRLCRTGHPWPMAPPTRRGRSARTGALGFRLLASAGCVSCAGTAAGLTTASISSTALVTAVRARSSFLVFIPSEGKAARHTCPAQMRALAVADPESSTHRNTLNNTKATGTPVSFAISTKNTSQNQPPPAGFN